MGDYETNNGSRPALDPITHTVGVIILLFILTTLLLALTICLLPISLWTRPAQARRAAAISDASRRSRRPPLPPLAHQYGLLGMVETQVAPAPVEKVEETSQTQTTEAKT